jgi:hypothetical protein
LKKKGEGNKNNREDNHDQSTLFAYMEMSWWNSIQYNIHQFKKMDEWMNEWQPAVMSLRSQKESLWWSGVTSASFPLWQMDIEASQPQNQGWTHGTGHLLIRSHTNSWALEEKLSRYWHLFWANCPLARSLTRWMKVPRAANGTVVWT